jgi:hypothetical protein
MACACLCLLTVYIYIYSYRIVGVLQYPRVSVHNVKMKL